MLTSRHGALARAAILALAVATPPPETARPGAVPEQEPRWRSGQFLVATETIADPRFDHTLIYLVDHDMRGAFGLVVNRPLGKLPLIRVLEPLGLEATGVSGDIRVYYGGPVQPTQGFVLHTEDYTDAETRLIRDGIALTSDRAILEAIAGAGGHGARSLPSGTRAGRPANSRTRSSGAPGSPYPPTEPSYSTRTTTVSGSARWRAAESSFEVPGKSLERSFGVATCGRDYWGFDAEGRRLIT